MKDALRNNPEPIKDVSILKKRIRELEQSVEESRRTEAALRENEEKYRFLSENMADVAFMVDMDLRTTYVSPSIERILGFTPEERRTQQVQEQMPPQSLQLIFETLTEEMEREKAEDADPDRSRTLALEYYHKDRSIKSLETNIRGIRDSKGALTGFYGLSRDITERKRVQEALRVSETRYRLLAENARDVIWTVDLDMRLTYVSPSVTRLLGFTEEEAMARTMQQAFTQTSFVKAMEIFAEEMAIESAGDGDPARSRLLELDLVRKDGNTVTVEGNFCFLRDPAGKAIGILAIMRDITDRKRAEESLRDSENRYRELSIIDDLTQLYNSRHFYHQLRIEIDRANRYEQPLTLLLLDLDDFKEFNDAYGHIEGDQVLLRLGQVVKRQLRQTDSAYRYGGEEFTILLPMTTSKDGIVTAERIRTEFKKEYFSPVPSQDIHVTLSIGLAQYKLKEDMKALVHRVDQLMYLGKKSGKDRVCSEP